MVTMHRQENRMTWRNLLFTAPKLGDYISGAILYEETLFQNDPAGKPFVEVLNANGIIPGIKVDTGLTPLFGGEEGETWCVARPAPRSPFARTTRAPRIFEPARPD